MIIDESQFIDTTPADDTPPASGGGEGEAPEAEAAETEEAEGEELEAEAEGDTEAEGEEGQETEGEEEGDDTSDEEVDLEEVEWQGQKYKIHPDLKPALMMQADYTRKTQEVAEQRKTLEEQQQTFQQQVEAYQALASDFAQVQAYDQQLAQFEQVDWSQYDTGGQDPMKELEGQNLWRRYQQLKDARDKAAQSVQHKQHERSQAAQREAAKRAEEYHSALAREFPDWSPDLDLQLTNFARQNGYSDQELASVRDVRAVKLLRKAMEGEQLKEKLRKQQTAAKAKPKKEVKPLAKPAQGRAPANTGLSDDLPPEEWVRRRNKEEAKKREARGF